MSRPFSPCRECGRRTPGCHGTCGEYLEYRAKLDEYNAVTYREKEKYHQTTVKMLAMDRALRRNGKL